MEWVYDNRQKEKEIFNAYLERFTLIKGIGIYSRSIIRKEAWLLHNGYIFLNIELLDFLFSH